MWAYYFKLALLSIKKTPVLSLLMVLTTAVGIAACLTVLTMYSVIASNPMAHKNDSIYAVQLDSWDPNQAYPEANNIPVQLTYNDASAILQADVPEKTVVMFLSGSTVQKEDMTGEASIKTKRMTTRDFFSMFDVEFVNGGPWTSEQDIHGDRVVVINQTTSQTYFGTGDSVGRSLSLDGVLYTVVGVVSDDWRLVPNVYDLNNGAFNQSPEIYIPLMNVTDGTHPRWGSSWDWSNVPINSFADRLNGESIWLQVWVELIDSQQRRDFESFLTAYINSQKKLGRFQRPLKFQLNSPEQWLDIYGVVTEDNKLHVVLSIAFLLVCLVNTIVMLLAKFLRKAPEVGIRRALGANRESVFSQHICEALVIGVIGSIIGLLLSWPGLSGIRSLYSYYENVAVLSTFTVVAAVTLAIAVSILSGMLPAWKISMAQPASYLKTH